MIVTVTPNPALDITYAVEALALGESHRVADVIERAGGKGLNVAAVLASMGREVVAVAPVGTDDRARFAGDLAARGVPHRLVASPIPTRRSVAIVEPGGRATLLNEPGVAPPQAVWDEVGRQVSALATPGSVTTVSGSLPPDVDPDLILRLTEQAQAARGHVVLDVRGPALLRALAAGPALVKPNRSEAAESLASRLGRSHSTADLVAGISPVDAARGLVEAGARSAVISDGAEGIALVHEDVILWAWLPTPVRGNPTGAGDALTAALAADIEESGGLPRGRDAWAQVLRRAVAWSAAAVRQPVAGIVDPADCARMLPQVAVEEIRP